MLPVLPLYQNTNISTQIFFCRPISGNFDIDYFTSEWSTLAKPANIVFCTLSVCTDVMGTQPPSPYFLILTECSDVNPAPNPPQTEPHLPKETHSATPLHARLLRNNSLHSPHSALHNGRDTGKSNSLVLCGRNSILRRCKRTHPTTPFLPQF